MDVNKNNIGGNNGWILCHSKSFPGKFYYFNVHNGEAVWSINSNEKSIPKIDNKCSIQRTNNKVHNYPEPSSPPVYSPANVFSNGWPDTGTLSQNRTLQNFPLFGQQIPIFGQQVLTPNFQNCLPMTNIGWTPMQHPFWPNFSASNTRTPSIERVPETLQMEKEILVHASGTPLSQRFVNYEATSINFNKENKYVNEIVTSKPLTNSNSKIEVSQNQIHKYIPESFIDMESKLVKDNFRSIATQTGSDNLEVYSDIPISPDKGKPENTEKANVDEAAAKKIVNESDLRLILLAKRRQFQAEDLRESIEKKKLKLHVIPSEPKKKVTFNLENVHSDNYEYVPKSPPIRNIASCNIKAGTMHTAVSFYNSSISVDQHLYEKENYNITEVKETNTVANEYETILKNNGAVENTTYNAKNNKVNATETTLPKSEREYTSEKDIWYLVVDMDILLDYKMLVDKLMQADEKCRLLIPDALHNALELLCIGDCGGQQRVLVARQLSRSIAALHKQIIVEPPQSDDIISMNTTDHILKSCVNAIKNNFYVVLITNDGHLKTRANALKIRCYTTQDVKNGAIRPKLFSAFKKIKFTIDNEKTHESNSYKGNKLSNLFPIKNNTNTKDSNKDFDILCNITKPKPKMSQNKSHDDFNLLSTETINIIEKSNNKESGQHSSTSTDTITQNISQPIKEQNEQISDKTILNHENVAFSNTQKTKTIKSIFFPSEDARLSDSITSKENDSSSNENNYFHHIPKRYQNKTDASKENIVQIDNRNYLNFTKNDTQNKLTKFKIPKLSQNNNVKTDLKNVSDATDHNRSIFKNAQMNVDCSLKKYCVIAKDLNHTIRKRMDEWICTYTQIMEELLSNILQEKSVYMSKMNISTTKLQDSLICVKMLYNDCCLRDIIELLIKLLSQCTCYKGKIKLDTDPLVLMKIIGCGVLLVECLKDILPEYGVLWDCESYLNTLLENIEAQDVDLELELLRPEVVCRSEVVSNKETRHNYTKDRSYIIEYLKKHYKEWAESDISAYISHNNLKVVRTNGKDLKWVKIDKDKSVSYIQATKQLDDDDLAETVLISNDPNYENSSSIGNYKFNSATKSSESAIKIIQNIDNVQLSKYGNTFTERDDTTSPKMIRNIKLIDKYEGKIKIKEPLNANNLDINSNTNNISTNENYVNDDDDSNKSVIISHNKISYNNNFYDKTNKNISNISINVNKVCGDLKSNAKTGDLSNNGGEENNSKDYYENNDRENSCERNNNNDGNSTMQLIHRDDSTVDSGFENESTQAHSLVKTFLNEFSCAFKVIYNFIGNFTSEIRVEAMCQDRKNIHHIKANRYLTEMDAIIQQLKSIIHRESKEDTTLRSLLLSAGTEAINDKRITRYRQIVEKCLEQAQILESALRIIVCISSGDLKAINYNSDISNSYINIFE